MIKLLGLFNIVYVILGLVWLAKRDPDYSFTAKPISALAKNPKNKFWFMMLLSTFALLQLIFAFTLISRLATDHAQLIKSLLTIGSLLLVLATLVTVKSSRLHTRLVQVSVATIAIAVTILALEIMKVNELAGWLIISSSVILLTGQHILRNVIKVGYWELPLLILVIVWNVTTTLLIASAS